MEFFTTRFINERIKKEYLAFVSTYYSDIFANQNKYVELTESKIASYLGGGYVKLLDSGTTALQLGLLALGVQEGDEVIIPANTYSATAIAVTNIGAIPVFADIRLDNYTLDCVSIEEKITPRTRVILPVHIYGHSAEMDDIVLLAQKYNLKVFEDASHAFGGEYFGKKMGTIGDAGAFSCHVTKNFGTFGNGGIFYTKDKAIFDRITSYIFPDTLNREVLKSGRTPANMLALDAIVLLLKLKYIDMIISHNLEMYIAYKEKYKDFGFLFPQLHLEKNKLHIRNFVVLSSQRDEYIKAGLGKQYYNKNLSEDGIFGTSNNLKNTGIFFEKNLALNFYFGIN